MKIKSPELKIYYIYAIINPLDNKILYIGKTKNLAARKLQHWNKPLNSTLKELKNECIKSGLKFKFIVLEQCDEFNINQQEQYWIQKYKSLDLKNQHYNIPYQVLQKEVFELTKDNANLHSIINKLLDMESGGRQYVINLENEVRDLKTQLWGSNDWELFE